MLENDTPKVLRDALAELCAAIKAKGKDVTSDKEIENVVECLGEVFADMRTIYCPYIFPSDKSTRAEKEKVYNLLGSEIPENLPDSDDVPSQYHNAMDVVFPPFVDAAFPLQRALHVQQNATITLLPYLLSSYYLSLYRIPLAERVGKRLFPDPWDNYRDGNYGVEVRRFASRFSLAKRIPAFLHQKHTREPKMQKLKSHSDMVDYLTKSPKNEVYYSQWLKAFIYSACATACIHELSNEITSRIDFAQSYKLFNEHTLAFSIRYHKPEIWDDEEDDEGEGFDMFEFVKGADPSMWKSRYDENVDEIRQHTEMAFKGKKSFEEITPSIHRLLCDAKFYKCLPDSQEFFMQYAVLCFALYNPLACPYLVSYTLLIDRVLQYKKPDNRYIAPYLSGPKYKLDAF